MNRILSKISGPLLVGSILALGAMAFTVHADAADGARFMFRLRPGVLPMQVAAAPEDDGKTDGGDEVPPEAHPPLNLGMLLFTPTAGDLTDATGDGKIGMGDKLGWGMTLQNYTENTLDTLAFDVSAGPFRVRVECGSLAIDENTTCAGTYTLTEGDICGLVAPLRDGLRDQPGQATMYMQLASVAAYGETHTSTKQQALAGNIAYTFTDAGANCPA